MSDPVYSTILLPPPSPDPSKIAKIVQKIKGATSHILKVKCGDMIHFFNVSEDEYSKASVGSEVEFREDQKKKLP